MSEKVSLRVKIETDSRGLTTATVDARELDAAVREVSRSARKATSAMSAIATAGLAFQTMSDAVGKLGDVVGRAAAGFDDFDRSMRAANTMMGLSEDGFQEMKSALSDISREVPKTRAELADGLYQVISNGVTDPVEALRLLETSARSSVGGIADLGQVVGVTATVMKNYGMEAGEAAAIQDKIQKTAQNGVTSFEQLASALPRVTASGATLGVTIDELLATFATLTGVSGNTAEVSTQLAAVLNALIKPSSEASTMAEQMGISFDAASIRMAGGLESFLGQLSVAVDDYSQASGVLREEVIGTLFGSAEALKALLPLMGGSADTFSANVEAMAESAGTMDAAFDQMRSTGEASRTMLQNSIQTMTEWAGSVASACSPTLDYITSAGDLCLSVGAIGKAMTTVVPLLRNSTVVIGALTAAQHALNVAMNANPIGLIVTAVAALVAGVTVCIRRYDEWGAAVLTLVSGPIGWLVNAVMSLVRHWESLTKAFSEGGFVAGMKRLGEVLLDAVLMPLQQILELASKLPGVGNLAASGAESIENIRRSLNLIDPKPAQQAAEAVEALAQSADKAGGKNVAGGSIRTQPAVAVSKPTAGSASPTKPEEPREGSLAYVEQQIREVTQLIRLEIDPQSRAALSSQLKQLEEQKHKIELDIEMEQVDMQKIDTTPTVPEMPTIGAEVAGMGELKTLTERTREYTEAQRESTSSQMTASGMMQSLGSSFGSMGQAVGGATGQMLEWSAQTLAAIAAVVPMIATLVTAKQAEGIAGATASGSSMPFPLNLAAIAAGVAAVIASFAKMPKFAEGGIAYGPTVGLFGEYAGASHNPEVVAPLDRLRSLLGEPQGMGGDVRFEIKGRRLVGVLERENGIRNRR